MQTGIASQQAPIIGPDYVETHVRFGVNDALCGVLCTPHHRIVDAPTIVFVNAGRNYHIGWARSSVAMARDFAARGYPSLRFDVAGIGDSPEIAGRNPQAMYGPECIDDLATALDFLASRDFSKFCVLGLCSGAHLVFHTATRDPRIEGLVMANLQRFIWRDGVSLEIAIRRSYRSTQFYTRSLLRGETWKRLTRGEVRICGIVREVLCRFGRKAIAKSSACLGASSNESATIRDGFQRISQRGAKTLLIYSDSDGGLDELARHMGAGYKGLARYPGVRMARIEGADHNITPRAARETLAGLVADFLGELGSQPAPNTVPAHKKPSWRPLAAQMQKIQQQAGH